MTDTINTGGAAFPHENSTIADFNEGMTLRDYFAAKAMQAIFSNGQSLAFMSRFAEEDGVASTLYTARSAYAIADAMLAARGGAL